MGDNADAPQGLGPGSIIGGYRLERQIGEGGMGVVFAATQMSLNRVVALKLVSPSYGADVAFRERFRREGLAQAGLDHPHIVTVYEAGEADGTLFIAMRLVQGASLKDMITGRELDAGRTLRILGPVADALDSAHEAGIIHRDVKPHNILVGRRDHAFLADFGLTKGRDGASLTRTGQFVGSLDYVSPEQIRGERATAASDVYSLGAVLFECLTGVVPYPKESEAAVLYAHMADAPPKVTDIRPELPEELDAVLSRAMAKDPEARHREAVDVVEEAKKTFARKTRAAMAVPAPVERAEEEGLRPPEAFVSTAASRRMVTPPPAAAPPAEATSAPAPAPAAAVTPPPSVGVQQPEAGSGRRSPVGYAVAAVAAAALVGGAFVLGHRGEKVATDGARVLTAGVVSVNAPTGWRESRNLAPIAGLEFRQAIALENAAGDGTLRVGMLTDDARGRLLLPQGFRANLGEQSLDTEDTVRLGGVSAYRYADLEVPDVRGGATIYAAPTTEGILGAACTGTGSARETCERIANTVELVDGKALELGPSESYARALDRAVDGLADLRGTLRELDAASTRSAQARLLMDLADGYEEVAAGLESAQPGPGAEESGEFLVDALRRASRAYAAMGSNAARGREKPYASARKAASTALDDARRELDNLASFGYGRLS